MKKLSLFVLFAVIGLFVSASPSVAKNDKQQVEESTVETLTAFDDWGMGEVLAAMTTKVAMPLPKIVADKNVNFNEKVNGDLIVAGGDVDVASVINGDVFAAGGTVIVDGDIKGNLIAAGGEVVVRGGIGGKVIVAGGKIRIEEGAVIGGYLLVGGGNIEVSGKVDGDTRLAGGEVVVQPSAILAGNLTVDGSVATVADGAKIAGTKQINITENKDKNGDAQAAKTMRVRVASIFAGMFTALKLAGLVGQVVLMLILVKIFGKYITSITKLVTKSFWATMGWGFAKLFLTPILIIILLITVVGLPAAVLATFIYMVMLFLANYIAGATLGHFAFTRGWLKTNNLYIQAVLGLVAIELVGVVPLVGWLIKCGALLTGLGVIVAGERKLLTGLKK